jgi:hypothetical protein
MKGERGQVGLEGKRIDDAQKILDRAIANLNLSIKCMVINYRSENYRVQFFTWENKLIRGIGFNIPEEWIEDINPTKNDIHDELKGLLIELEQEAGREMRDLDK